LPNHTSIVSKRSTDISSFFFAIPTKGSAVVSGYALCSESVARF
jgi:hypothetical protein